MRAISSTMRAWPPLATVRSWRSRSGSSRTSVPITRGAHRSHQLREPSAVAVQAAFAPRAGFCVVTNKVPLAPYRGAGRPELSSPWTAPRHARREAGHGSAELRFKNIVQPEEMPYRPGTTYRDGVPCRTMAAIIRESCGGPGAGRLRRAAQAAAEWRTPGALHRARISS